jgi:hypothetical protein
MDDSDEGNVISLTEFRDKRQSSEYRLEEDLTEMFSEFETEDLHKLQGLLSELRESVMSEDEIRAEEGNIPELEVVKLEMALSCLHDVFNNLYGTQCYVLSTEVHQRIESIRTHLIGLSDWVRGWRSEQHDGE